LRWWRRDVIIDAIKRGGPYKWGLESLLNRLVNVDEYVWAFLGRFDLDLRCSVEVYVGGEELCVRFHVGYCESRLYCYASGQGWRPVSDMPKFARYQPLEGNRLVEVYRIGDKEFVRVA